MKMGLVTWQESSGLDYVGWMPWPVKDSGSYMLTIHLLMDQKVIYHIASNFGVGPATEQYP